MAKDDKALVPVNMENFVLAQRPAAEILQLVKENLGGQKIDPVRDLDRIKIPPGGGTFWNVPGLTGDTPEAELQGVIMHWQNARAYWQEAFSGGTPPQCVSDDGITGQGNPGGDCMSCPFAQWGSSDKDGSNAQACKSIMRLFVIQPDSLLPIVIGLPPTSIRPARQYINRLTSKGLGIGRVMTKFTLEKASSNAGIAYAKVVLSFVGVLSEDDQQKVTAYRTAIAPMLVARAVSEEEYKEMSGE